MNRKSTSPTYIIEFETGLTKRDRDICEKQLRVGKQVYNGVLGVLKKRALQLHRDPEYIALMKEWAELSKKQEGDSDGQKLTKAECDVRKKEIGTRLNELRKIYKFNGEYCANDVGTQMRQHFGTALYSSVITKLCVRAYHTVRKVEQTSKRKTLPDGTTRPMSFEERLKAVKFVKKDDDFSIENINDKGGLRLKNGLLYFNKNTAIDVDMDKVHSDPYYELAMQDRIKFARLVRRTIRGKKRYYVQLAMEGTPPMINRCYGDGTVELMDVKISHYDVVDGNGEIKTVELAPGCRRNEEKIAELNRKMDASRRATNPNKYNPDGTINSKNKDPWVYSNRYRKLRTQYHELQRKNAELRKVTLEKQANDILEVGTNINLRHLSYKDLQKRKSKTEINEKTGMPKSKAMAGKEIGNRSPGYFVQCIKRKAEYVGGTVTDLS